MTKKRAIFQRTELLLGNELMNRIREKRVILFGVGGVGSWCAESLIRSGIKFLTIVDSDLVAESNINRQLMATTKTIGNVKVEELKQRLLDINPDAEITAIQEIYSDETSDSFQLATYDYIIDAIDSLSNKVHLIRTATRTKAKLFSSMGAALKMDPQRIKVTEFWKVKGCPLGAALRRKMKEGERPSKKFMCVFSDELLKNNGTDVLNETYEPMEEVPEVKGNPALVGHDWNVKKAQINGTLPHITAIFGLTLSGLVIQDICK